MTDIRQPGILTPGVGDRRFRRLLFVLTLIAAVLRLVAWMPGLGDSAVYTGGDTAEYQTVADDLAAAYGSSPGSLQDLGLRRPPGYPLLLAAFRAVSERLPWLALCQVAIGLTLVVLTGWVGKRLFGATAGLIAAGWVTVDPLMVVNSSVLLTETPFAVLLVLTVAGVHRCGEASRSMPLAAAAGAGLALAVATFVRPISLYLALLLVPLIFAISPPGRRRWLVPLVFGLAAVLPVAAWMTRNHALYGEAVFSTIDGANMLDYRAAGSLGEQERIPISEARSRVQARARAEMEPGMNAAERSRVSSRVGVEVIVQHPVGYLLMAARGALMTLAGPGTSGLAVRLGGSAAGAVLMVFVALSAASAVACVLLASWALVVALRRRSWAALPVAVPLVYLLVIGSGQESYSRFRVPLMPLLALLAAFVIVYYTRGRWMVSSSGAGSKRRYLANIPVSSPTTSGQAPTPPGPGRRGATLLPPP